MAYIGKQPTVGNFVKLDTITATATTTFNLLNGGVAYYPQSANHCLVSLNGILQAPTDSFTISGSTIIFSSALTTSDVIDFIIVLGDVLNIGTPSDNTVSLAKLTATGTKNSTTFLRGDNTFATAVSAGAVLQVIHAVNTTADTSSSGTYAASSLTASVTPSSTSNKILILLSCSAYASSSGSGGVSHGAIYRQIAGGGYSDIYSPILLSAIKQTSLYAGASSSAEYLDSPSTTSQIDYKLYFKLNSGTDTTLSNDSTKKSFTLLEIKG